MKMDNQKIGRQTNMTSSLNSGKRPSFMEDDVESEPITVEHTKVNPKKLACTCPQDAKNDLQLLVRFINEGLGELISLRENTAEGKLQKIAFEHLWNLYQPGDIVVSSRSDVQAYKVIHISGGWPLMVGQDSFAMAGVPAQSKHPPGVQAKFKYSPSIIDCVRIDFDGEKFGPVQTKVEICEFDEERVIRKLGVYCLRFAEDETQLESTLVNRGQYFVELASVKHKKYSGLSMGETQEEVNLSYITITSYCEEVANCICIIDRQRGDD